MIPIAAVPSAVPQSPDRELLLEILAELKAQNALLQTEKKQRIAVKSKEAAEILGCSQSLFNRQKTAWGLKSPIGMKGFYLVEDIKTALANRPLTTNRKKTT